MRMTEEEYAALQARLSRNSRKAKRRTPVAPLPAERARLLGAGIQVVVPGLPIAKARARVTQYGSFTPKKTKQYEQVVQSAARTVMGDDEPLAGPLTMTMHCVLPVPKSWTKKKKAGALAGTVMPISRPDLDNYAKAISDGLNEIVFGDDSQIVEIIALKSYGEQPQTIVRITPYKQAREKY